MHHGKEATTEEWVDDSRFTHRRERRGHSCSVVGFMWYTRQDMEVVDQESE